MIRADVANLRTAALTVAGLLAAAMLALLLAGGAHVAYAATDITVGEVFASSSDVSALSAQATGLKSQGVKFDLKKGKTKNFTVAHVMATITNKTP